MFELEYYLLMLKQNRTQASLLLKNAFRETFAQLIIKLRFATRCRALSEWGLLGNLASPRKVIIEFQSEKDLILVIGINSNLSNSIHTDEY